MKEKGDIMACNFKIVVHKNSDNLHLKLTGAFDGTSALKLISSLKTRKNRASKVFIHTSSLTDIYPFGKNVFEDGLDSLDGQVFSLVFTGEKAKQLIPKNAKLNCTLS
jgi:hypothetical protein